MRELTHDELLGLIDEADCLLDDPNIQLAILSAGWYCHILGISNDIDELLDYDSLVERDYSAILDFLRYVYPQSQCLYILYYVVLQYTRPDSRCCIYYDVRYGPLLEIVSVGADEDIDRVTLTDGTLSSGSICTGDDLISAIIYTLDYSDDESWPSPGIDDIIYNNVCLENYADELTAHDADIPFILFQLQDRRCLNVDQSLLDSFALWKVRDMYMRVLENVIPPPCIQRRQRTYTYGDSHNNMTDLMIITQS